MKVTKTSINGVVVIEPEIFKDERGCFFEAFNEREFKEKVSPYVEFKQDNESESVHGVLRGLHFQNPPYAQSKLVRVVEGAVMDVAVDLRKNSKTYKQWCAVLLTGENHRQLFLPQGMAHGFVVLSDKAKFQYKCGEFYHKESESGIAWNDPTLNINWFLPEKEIILSEKDKNNMSFEEFEKTNPF